MSDSNKHFVSSWDSFFSKMSPGARCTAAVPPFSEIVWGFVGSLIGIGIICYLSYIHKTPLLIASFGASAVLLYGVPALPVSQPRNVLGGHLIAATVGVCFYQLLSHDWFTAALSTAVTIAVMLAVRMVHPPAGATALIAVITERGWDFIIMPVGIGAVILILVAVLFNNLSSRRNYPTYWW